MLNGVVRSESRDSSDTLAPFINAQDSRPPCACLLK